MSDHRGDFRLAIYNQQGSIGIPPVSDFIVCAVKQSSMYRFKQIFVGVNGESYNGSGIESAVLRFYRGNIFQLPSNSTQISGLGVKVGEIPVSRGQTVTQSTTLFPYNRMLHNTSVIQPFGPSYSLGDGSGGVSTLGPSFDLEVECDFMTLSLSISGNLWGGGPAAFLAVRGFTHPPKLYHENNFEYYL